MAAVKELRQAKDAEKAAQQSEEETKAILDFFKNTLLSAGRPAGASLSEVFWAGGPGQGRDAAQGGGFDRVAGRRGVRRPAAGRSRGPRDAGPGLPEHGRAGAGGQAVPAPRWRLREAMQGANDPDDGRLPQPARRRLPARRPAAEAGRLFDHNPNSPAHAAALAVRGAMLLLEKKPAEAELKLRECLTIRQKIQPDDWTTFDTDSMLGEALLDQKKFADAEPLLLSGYEGMKQREATIPPRTSPASPRPSNAWCGSTRPGARRTRRPNDGEMPPGDVRSRKPDVPAAYLHAHRRVPGPGCNATIPGPESPVTRTTVSSR